MTIKELKEELDKYSDEEKVYTVCGFTICDVEDIIPIDRTIGQEYFKGIIIDQAVSPA